MLYVFNVDTGAMFTFDMSLAIESVNQLMLEIEKMCKIATNKQVLLVSGGETLDPNARVCSYSAGTDTNPIYLYNLAYIEAVSAPPPSIEQGVDIDFSEKVRELSDMPATYHTVCQRTLLAQQFYDSAKDVTRICENIVHEQHLQQQGWAAVVANFEDTVASFTRQSEIYNKSFQDFMKDREEYLEFLKHFYEDLRVLSKIPILPALAEAQRKAESKEEDAQETQTTSEGPANFNTLLEWVASADKKNNIDQLFEHCKDSLDLLKMQTYNNLQAVVQNILTEVKMEDYIDIKGLSDRLCGLEKLMFEAKKHVQEQGDLAQSFSQNQIRASNLGDTSILPDLCASHRKQLKVMLENHNQLIDNRRRCVKAKAELGEALHRRLKWIANMEDVIRELNHKMMVHRDNLQRLRGYLIIIQQIHLAPTTYLSAVAEVVRRRAFSQAFLSWASEIACHLLAIYNDEITRRKDFQSHFENHFLNLLFPGMEDMPPAFATEAPTPFDSNLPKLSVEDIEQLKQDLPDVAENVVVPDIAAINNLFLVKSIIKADLEKADDRGVEEKIVQVVNEVGLASNLDRNLLKPAESETCLTVHGIPHLKDLDKGCESETDTEEFEKVGQSPLELHFEKDISSPRPRTHDVSTLTEDNLESSRSEHDRLKSLLGKMGALVTQAVKQLKADLDELKSNVATERSTMELQYESLSSSWENLTTEIDNKEKEIRHRLKLDHELEISSFKKLTEDKNEQLKMLQVEVAHLEKSLNASNEEVSSLKKVIDDLHQVQEKEKSDFAKSLDELEQQKEQGIKEISEKLTREHKAEIENIRQRFRLMSIAKMERSPSDSNLDGIERGDMKELPNHEAIILQLKENCEVEKEKAINAAVLQESRKWESILNEKLAEMKTKHELEKEIFLDEASKKITEEKDKLIDLLREREANLNLECIKYKNTIQQLTETENDSQICELVERVEALEKDKNELEAQLTLERSKRINESMQDMGASVAVCEAKGATAANLSQADNLTKSQTSLVKAARLNIDSCHIGAIVLVLWDSTYKNYRIIQESSHLYFLHSDCLTQLGLNIRGNEERKPYFTGEVVEKEYCHAKKMGNRYNVSKGTKFFRVKVKPLAKEPKEDKDKSFHMSHSETAGPSTAECLPSTSVASVSLPVTPLKQSPVEAEEKLEKSETSDAENLR